MITLKKKNWQSNKAAKGKKNGAEMVTDTEEYHPAAASTQLLCVD